VKSAFLWKIVRETALETIDYRLKTQDGISFWPAVGGVDFRVFSGKICLILFGWGVNFEFLRGLDLTEII